MKHQASRELFGYWNGLRGARSAPERGDIDPAAIRNVLADTFMLDVDPAVRFPFRLAGTRVNGLFDAEQKGRSFLSLWRAEERRNIAAILLTVADGACPVVAGAAAAPVNQDECALEFLFLPLRHHGKTHSRILGLVKATAKPAWLGLLPVGPLVMRSLRVLDQEVAETRAADEGWSRGTASAARALAPSVITYGEKAPTRPALRVIQGGL